MGKASQALEDFIDEIPDDKLRQLPASGVVYSNRHYRLDVQGVGY
jgi:hypothetical protein